MKIAERLYEISKQLPDQMQTELLDFAEFLVYKNIKKGNDSTNLGKMINEHFKRFNIDEFIIPPRSIMRNPPGFNL